MAPSASLFPKLLSRNSTRVATINPEIGQQVEVDDEVVVLETGKSDAKVRSTHKGVITGFLFKEGDVVKIGEPLFEVDTEGKPTVSDTAAQPKQAAQQEAPKKEEAPKKDQGAQAQASAQQPKPAEKAGKFRITKTLLSQRLQRLSQPEERPSKVTLFASVVLDLNSRSCLPAPGD